MHIKTSPQKPLRPSWLLFSLRAQHLRTSEQAELKQYIEMYLTKSARLLQDCPELGLEEARALPYQLEVPCRLRRVHTSLPHTSMMLPTAKDLPSDLLSLLTRAALQCFHPHTHSPALSAAAHGICRLDWSSLQPAQRLFDGYNPESQRLFLQCLCCAQSEAPMRYTIRSHV